MHLKYHILLKILILKFVPVIHWSPRMDTILFETVLFLPHFFISMHSQIEHNSVQDSSLLLTVCYPKMNASLYGKSLFVLAMSWIRWGNYDQLCISLVIFHQVEELFDTFAAYIASFFAHFLGQRWRLFRRRIANFILQKIFLSFSNFFWVFFK